MTKRRTKAARLIFITALMLITSLSLAFSSYASGLEARAQVDEPDGVILRTEPTTESARLAALRDRTQITVKKIVFTDDTYTWYSVSTPSGEGYMRSDLIKITSYSHAAATAASDITCRSGAGTAMSITGTIGQGETFTVRLEAESIDHTMWYMIDDDNYVPAENVTVAETETDADAGNESDNKTDSDDKAYQSEAALKVAAGACKWAREIAADNRFHYGYGKAAHHNGCYFCSTNTKSGGRSKKGVKDYKYTYCCNPFVHAAFAHGGGEETMLKICQRGSSYWVTDYPKSKLFVSLGRPDMSELRMGDVLCSSNHVMLYLGDGEVAEAAGGDDNIKGSKKWNNSIRVCKLSKTRYKKYKAYRYVG